MQNHFDVIICVALIIIIPVVLAVFGCNYVYGKGKINPIDKLGSDGFYLRAIDLNNRWLFSEFAWETIYIVLSVMPFVLTLIVLFVECSFSNAKNIIIVLSIVSLSFMSVAYFLKPHNQAQMFRRAYEVLRPSIIEYESRGEQTEEVRQKLWEAIKVGENYIGTAIE